jgi:carbon monoxide dehydrogenase subunit G
MPGLQDFEIIDDDNSRWVLKVGVGALVRTVKVDVHVDEWDGPRRALFSFKLQGDPVKGGGAYVATPTGANQTEMAFTIRVEGTGPMAPMWEAMGGPLLPRFALAFGNQLAESIEQASGVSAPPETAAPSLPARLLAWLRELWCSLRGVPTSR